METEVKIRNYDVIVSLSFMRTGLPCGQLLAARRLVTPIWRYKDMLMRLYRLEEGEREGLHGRTGDEAGLPGLLESGEVQEGETAYIDPQGQVEVFSLNLRGREWLLMVDGRYLLMVMVDDRLEAIAPRMLSIEHRRGEE